MTSLELTEIVDNRMHDPAVLGRLACNMHSNDAVEQRHHDDRNFQVAWQDSGDFWRCVISDTASGKCLAQVDVHDNATSRVDAFEPCRVTVSPTEGLLCLTRYRSA